jgi:hypothetical protein
VLIYLFREPDKKLNKASIYLAIPALLLSFSFFMHYNPSTQFITWLTLLTLLSIQLILLSNIDVAGIFSLDMFCKFFQNLVAGSFANLILPIKSFGIFKGNKSKSFRNLIYILIGIGISLPFIVILMSLFTSADAVFSDSLAKVYSFIGLDFEVMFWKIVLAVILGLLLAGMLLGLKFDSHSQGSTYSITGNIIESTIIGTFLTLIDLSVILFVIFQFVYLFGGTTNITASGMNYSEYARRGFFELSAASFIIFAIALFAIIMTKKKSGKLPPWIQLATVCLCICNGVLLISSVKRMLLYVDVYGLSIKRVLTLWLMFIIGVSLLGIMIKCFADKLDVMKWIGLTVIVGVCILSLTNTERIIAKYNVDRYLSNPTENSIDINYLSQLSYTAMPEIMRLKALPAADKLNFDFNEILNIQKSKLKSRNNFYGFTLDYPQSEKIVLGNLN